MCDTIPQEAPWEPDGECRLQKGFPESSVGPLLSLRDLPAFHEDGWCLQHEFADQSLAGPLGVLSGKPEGDGRPCLQMMGTSLLLLTQTRAGMDPVLLQRCPSFSLLQVTLQEHWF
ncbi:unnamed protein product [Rangifer tarandus platyrhynchus]|uniref:Uncharacterized protein n=1 Tax=Rangifer tarandus platyrhynchus TaxID=3082113 RepID=A0ABN8XQQ5_RANTA|nr:unnamed protein product [Rangifer tarandus platyrhynchus]